MEERRVTRQLFVLNYMQESDPTGPIKQHPVYAVGHELAVAAALDWLLGQEEATYVSVYPATEEVVVDGIFYPLEEGSVFGELYLYVHEYFVNHTVIQRAIYAKTLEAAATLMNDYYRRWGLGNHHKSLDHNVEGITIDGITYPPTRKWTPSTL